jgi:phosphoribosylamine--glycine ligase
MGAYSPAPVVTPQIHAKVMREVIMPTLQGMEKDRIPYTGFLYAGLMIQPDGAVKVVEFNCRMGDPETQPIMMRLKSNFVTLLDAAIDGRLDKAEAEWDRRVALGVVLAAANYPETPRKGDAIHGLPDTAAAEAMEDAHIFHAGTADAGGQVVADTCAVVAPVRSIGITTMATNAGKMACYAPMHSGVRMRFGDLAACLDAALTGVWRGAADPSRDG